MLSGSQQLPPTLTFSQKENLGVCYVHLLHNSPVWPTLGSKPGDKKGEKYTNRKLFIDILVILQVLPSCSNLPTMAYFFKFWGSCMFFFPQNFILQWVREIACSRILPSWLEPEIQIFCSLTTKPFLTE